jgi:hypothetical protein
VQGKYPKHMNWLPIFQKCSRRHFKPLKERGGDVILKKILNFSNANGRIQAQQKKSHDTV